MGPEGNFAAISSINKGSNRFFSYQYNMNAYAFSLCADNGAICAIFASISGFQFLSIAGFVLFLFPSDPNLIKISNVPAIK